MPLIVIVAMNFSANKSLGKHVSHCSFEIDEWIILNFMFNVCDGHTCITDSVDRLVLSPIVLHFFLFPKM